MNAPSVARREPLMVQDTNSCRGTGYGLEEDFSSSLSLPFSDAIGSLQVHILGPYFYFFILLVLWC